MHFYSPVLGTLENLQTIDFGDKKMDNENMNARRLGILLLVALLGMGTLQQSSSAVAATSISNFEIENTLRYLGLSVGKVDGIFNESTRRAFCQWRELTGQRPTRHLLSIAERNWVKVVKPLRVTPNLDAGLNLNITCQSITWVARDSATKLLVLKGVFAASSGKPGYTTPNGIFRIFSQVNAWQESNIYAGAMMYRPKYFNGGRAIHGSASDSLVKTYPASHGCVRILHSTVNKLWAAGVGIGTEVQVYGTWHG